MDLFSSRELASGFWLLVVIVAAIRNPSVRESTARVLESFSQPKVLTPFVLLIVHTAFVVWCLRRSGFWTIDLLKGTVYWVLIGGLVMVVEFVTSRKDENLLKAVLVDSLKLLILIEFLAAEFTFPLLVEFFLVPFISLVVLVNAVAGMKEEHRSVEEVTSWIVSLFGFLVLGYVTWQLISGFSALDGGRMVREVLLAPILSVALVPFIYLLQLWATYEDLFLRLELGVEKTPRIKDYARRRLVTYLHLRPRRVNEFLGQHAGYLMSLRTTEDIDRLVSDETSFPAGTWLN